MMEREVFRYVEKQSTDWNGATDSSDDSRHGYGKGYAWAWGHA
jgi:hypothetical protein